MRQLSLVSLAMALLVSANPAAASNKCWRTVGNAGAIGISLAAGNITLCGSDRTSQ